jgi:hypothetical protein
VIARAAPVATAPVESGHRDAPLRDEWHVVVLGTNPAGYLRITETPRPGGGVVVSSFTKLVIRRSSDTSTMELHQTLHEDAAGKLVEFRTEQRMGPRPGAVTRAASVGQAARATPRWPEGRQRPRR